MLDEWLQKKSHKQKQNFQRQNWGILYSRERWQNLILWFGRVWRKPVEAFIRRVETYWRKVQSLEVKGDQEKLQATKLFKSGLEVNNSYNIQRFTLPLIYQIVSCVASYLYCSQSTIVILQNTPCITRHCFLFSN